HRSWQTAKRKKLHSKETTRAMSPKRSLSKAEGTRAEEGIPPLCRSVKDLHTRKLK
ncbi:hypothetical protein HAX54_008206, partial [Datura stramonium]|nr:hypothetical protein [Datura stramonium]